MLTAAKSNLTIFMILYRKKGSKVRKISDGEMSIRTLSTTPLQIFVIIKSITDPDDNF